MPPQPRKAVRAALRALAEGRAGLDVKALDLDDDASLYRLRVGAWRAVYSIDGREIVVLRIFHRGDGYAWLED